MTKAVGIAGLVRSAPGRGWAVLALFIGLGATAASPALTLGELQVQSSLGEPLSAVVQVDAAAGEALRRECFAPGADAAALPGIPRTDNLRMVLERQGSSALLRLAGQSPVREPLTQVVLQVRCPGLPRLTRAFVVLLDPAAIAPPPAARLIPVPRQSSRRTGVVPGGDIAPGSQYTVRPGDTLSGIASRIAGRPSYSVWPLAARIKTLNPSAFESGRADALIAGSRLQMPVLASLANTATTDRASRPPASRTPVISDNNIAAGIEPAQPRAPDNSRLSRAPVETPVLLGEPVGGTDLSYLVITMELSTLSRARIAERADQPEVTTVPDTGVATVESVVASAQVETTPWYGKAWYWLLALLAILVGAVLTLLVMRRQPAIEPAPAAASPWELDDEEAKAEALERLGVDDASPMLVEEPTAKVYDDFTGTFVDAEPSEETFPPVAKGADPEDDIQTHLMPTIDEPRPDLPDEGGLSLAVSDRPKLEGLEERIPTHRTLRDDQDINVTTLEETETELGDNGWVELDFEATQILEQDYLAEYAKSLKDKVKEQSEAPADEPAADTLAEIEDPLMAASELIEALDEDLLTAEMMELEEPASPDATSEMPAPRDANTEDDEDPTASVTTLELEADDNVVAIDQAKKNLEEDDADEQPRERGKKS